MDDVGLGRLGEDERVDEEDGGSGHGSEGEEASSGHGGSLSVVARRKDARAAGAAYVHAMRQAGTT
jgi:hypothetical protein